MREVPFRTVVSGRPQAGGSGTKADACLACGATGIDIKCLLTEEPGLLPSREQLQGWNARVVQEQAWKK